MYIKDNKMATPLFVIGKHRSGTSFLANLLLDHPQIAGIYYPLDSYLHKGGIFESSFFYDIDKKFYLHLNLNAVIILM